MQYTIVRSQRRRSIGIKIQHGEVRVSAPVYVGEREIADFVTSKQSWITRHLQAQQGSLAQLPIRRWQHGEQVLWLGTPLTLQVRDGQRNTITLIEKTLHIRLHRRTSDRPAQVRKLVIDWYHQQGMHVLNQLIPQLAEATKLNPTSWRIAHYTAKWGACDRRGQLSFSWRLFAAPPWVLNYVVLHELCHLQHFNHSAAFWQLVEHHAPNYTEAENWLKQHGHTLLNERVFSYVNTGLNTGQTES